MKIKLYLILPFFALTQVCAQEEEMTPDKNIGVLKREILHQDETCPISKTDERNFGLTPPITFNKIVIEKYDVPTPPRMKIPGLWPEYDGRVNKLTGLNGKYVPLINGTPREIADNFLTLYKQTLLLGDFPNNFEEPKIEENYELGFINIIYKPKYRNVNVAGVVMVVLDLNSHIKEVALSREIITDVNKVIATPDVENERVAVNIAADYLKSRLPHLKRYAVWGREAYVLARKGVPYTYWEVGGDSDCPSARYTFLINIQTSEIEEVSSDITKIE